MNYPGKTKYVEDSGSYNLIPVYREIRADFETPVSIFMKVDAKILLESVEQGENVGRFSIIALGKRLVIRLDGNRISITRYNGKGVTVAKEVQSGNPLEEVREYLRGFVVPDYEGLPSFFGGAIGYLGYETLRYFEEVPVRESEEHEDVPDGYMVVPEMVLVYDSVRRSVFVIALTEPQSYADPEACYLEAEQRIEEICQRLSQPMAFNETSPRDPLSARDIGVMNRMEKPDFLEAVETCKKHIRDGDIIQAVFSQQFAVETGAEPFELYRTLRVLNPSPYLFFLDFEDFCLIGSSPEVMVRVQDGELLLKPIAGTRPRGETVAADHAVTGELLSDPKERAEHLMLVDLGRNDLGRVSTAGSVRVTDFMKIEKYSHVMHMVSTVEGQLDEQYDVFDVIRACFPAGTLTGAPKVRAMEIIAELETRKRGPYGGMIFNLGFNGNLDSCITIRTILLKDKTAVIQAGAGIVADSVPEREYEETVNKAGALLEAIRLT